MKIGIALIESTVMIDFYAESISLINRSIIPTRFDDGFLNVVLDVLSK